MKTSNIFLTLFFISSIAFSQEQQLKKNEIRTNLVLSIASRKIPITYERVLHKNHSVGIDVFYDYDFFNPDYEAKFFIESKYGLRIFYKRYLFNKKYAEGFFLKPMVGIANIISDDTTFSGEPMEPINEIKKTMAFFLGYKFNFLKHFLLELQVNLTSASRDLSVYYGILPDVLGVSLGYRF